MSEAQQAEKASPAAERDPVVNDFQFAVATVNGTGSQTSNTALVRALFRMGIPVNGKNIFPSNIKGLPTWFTIRVSKDGYVARHETDEVLVAMNEATIIKDVQDLSSGAVCLYDTGITYTPGRDDILFYGVPVDELVKEQDVPRSLKEYVRNMVYVGALAYLTGIELEEIENALDVHFGGKEKPIKLNMDMAEAAYAWCEDAFADEPTCPYQVERMNETEGLILMDGNEAAALGAVFGGLTMMAWYPITPSSSLADNVMNWAGKLRKDPETGDATYAIIQAEDELAAIGMVLGAGWAGARAMTATSGPGMSLMTEFAGMAYFAEIPSVIWNVQRVGPSTGLPTRTSQGDLLPAYKLGHGDTKHVVLLPANLKEAFEFGWRAFDLAERIQTLVFVLSDLDLGMNLWMGEPFDYPDEPMDRGKVLTAEDLEELGTFGRYRDVDGDGIPYRTLPGTPHKLAGYFTRGTGHDENAVYSEDPDIWADNLERIDRKFETARNLLPQPVIDDEAGSEIGIIAFGTVDTAIVEGRDLLREEGIETDYLRLRALPMSAAVREFIEAHERVYVIENNHDGQLTNILRMEMPDLAIKVTSIAHLDGLPFTGPFVARNVQEKDS